MIISFLLNTLKKYGIYGIFLGMGLESMGIPGIGAALDLISGPLYHEYSVNPFLIILIADIGLTAGSAVAYWIGKMFQEKTVRYLERKNKLDGYLKAKKIAEKYGDAGIFFSQLYGTTRTFISYPAGIIGIPFKNFVIFTFLGGFAYCSIITGLSIYAYGFLKTIYHAYSKNIWLLIVLGILTFIFAAIFAAKFLNKTFSK